jgi:hypothetical protein
MEYLARRYSEMLTKGDVTQLFNMLRDKYGTIDEACKRIGIERKTFYNWRIVKQMNLSTKVKVLKTALDELPIETLGFLAKRSRDRTIEILSYLIEALYDTIVHENDPDRLRSLASKSEEVVEEFSVPLTNYLYHEIDNLRKLVFQRVELLMDYPKEYYYKLPFKIRTEDKFEVETEGSQEETEFKYIYSTCTA